MYIILITLSLYFNAYRTLSIFQSAKYTQFAALYRNWFAKKRLILHLHMAIKGQFVPFNARLDAVNKHPQLETVKNFADKEKTPLETQGETPDPSGCTCILLDPRHN